MKPFPLLPWLERNGIKRYVFAEQNGLSKRTVYEHCAGKRFTRGNTSVLRAIEAGTNGEVSLRQMIEWMELRRAEMEAKEVAE